jgi:hypothetical protein
MFPDSRYWAGDLARIRDAGIQAVQLWCVWGWIESEPGVYLDYRLHQGQKKAGRENFVAARLYAFRQQRPVGNSHPQTLVTSRS